MVPWKMRRHAHTSKYSIQQQFSKVRKINGINCWKAVFIRRKQSQRLAHIQMCTILFCIVREKKTILKIVTKPSIAMEIDMPSYLNLMCIIHCCCCCWFCFEIHFNLYAWSLDMCIFIFIFMWVCKHDHCMTTYLLSTVLPWAPATNHDTELNCKHQI